MTAPNLFRERGSYLSLNLAPRTSDARLEADRAPAITISRQTGARGIAICEMLHDQLQAENRDEQLPWTLYDSELGRKILQDHGLPEYLDKFIPDQAVSEFDATINELLGRHPSLFRLFKNSKETIIKLSKAGHSIIVGRGGNRVTETMHNVLKVRLIGSTLVRRRYLMDHLEVPAETADSILTREDNARRSYVKQHFHCDIDDPTLYDLVINTDRIEDPAVVQLIMNALQQLKR